jgi:sugar transferase (PEP-CTERM/EpsH1 system associated)
MAGVPGRIHGEQGRDVYDLDGSNLKYNLFRRVMKLFIHRYIAVSSDLAGWLIHTIGARKDSVVQIYNGVDTRRFRPVTGFRCSVGPEGFAPSGTLVVGTVGRMEMVKDQVTLVQAFLHLIETYPRARIKVRLVIIGDGVLREQSLRLLKKAGAEHLAWLPGERSDIPELMRAMDLFVLPSLAEGISNTILEAMASGLPVVATRVGGNPELVEEGRTGLLVPPADPAAMAKAIHTYLDHPEQLARHGQAGRERAEIRFSMETMVDNYLAVYDSVLKVPLCRGRVPVQSRHVFCIG